MTLRILIALGLVLCVVPVVQAGDSDKYLPPDTAVVLRLNVKALVESPSFKNDKEVQQQIKEVIDKLLADYAVVRKHLGSAGIDPYRDIHVLTAALPGDADLDKAFAILEGTFDPAQFRKGVQDAAAKPDSGLKLIKIGKHEVMEVTLAGRDEPLFACLVDKSTILGAGSKEKMTAALNIAGNDKAEPAKEVQSLLKLLDAKQHLSFAGTRAASVKLLDRANQPFGDAMAQLLEGAETIQGGLIFDKDCEIAFRFGAKDVKSAKQFFQSSTLALAAVRGLVMKKAKEDKDFVPLADFMKGLKTGLDGTNVVWRSQVPLATAGKLMKHLMK
jgi:hypothetical protein